MQRFKALLAASKAQGETQTPPASKAEAAAPAPADRPAEMTAAQAERLAKLQRVFARKGDDGDEDELEERFKHGAADCCINGRTTRQIPCRGLPGCPLRDNEQEPAHGQSPLPAAAPQRSESDYEVEVAAYNEKFPRDAKGERFTREHREKFTREIGDDARERLRGRGRGGRTREHGR
jgi:hypothetical protein